MTPSAPYTNISTLLKPLALTRCIKFHDLAIEGEAAGMEQETTIHLDDLDIALFLMLKLKDLFDRLEIEKKTILLRILAKRIMVNPEGEITGPELNAPFTYLKSLVDDFSNNNLSERGSSFVQLRPQKSTYLDSFSLSCCSL